MKLLASLDRRDQRLLSITGVFALCTIVLLVLVRPEEQADSGVPTIYSTAAHGAKAAYLLLARMGYAAERSEGPLESVADAADRHTVLILAEPMRAASQQETAAVRRVLAHGGRVFAAGFLGAAALPDNNVDGQTAPQLIAGICEAEPAGFSPITGGGKVVMREVHAGWKLDLPGQQAVYRCAGNGVVVTYPIDKGTVVWWASATPLENQDISRAGSLDLLLNSLQLKPGDRVVWDESLHAEPTAAWDPAKDRIILALLAQLMLAGLLLVLARGRRSGPLRPLLAAPRSSPMEFVRALGGLYRAAGANDVPVTIAYERFRFLMMQHYGIAGAQSASPASLALTLTQRFGITDPALESDLTACDGAGRMMHLNARQALTLVQALSRHREQIARQAHSDIANDQSEKDRGTFGPEHEHTDEPGTAARLRRSA